MSCACSPPLMDSPMKKERCMLPPRRQLAAAQAPGRRAVRGPAAPPARELRRLRGICRLWRSLLSDPRFIAAHSACHPDPLIYVMHIHKGYGIFFEIMNLSLRFVKRVLRTMDEEEVISEHLGFVCIVNGPLSRRRHKLLNPFTGAVFDLPTEATQEHKAQVQGYMNCYSEFITVGQVSSTGIYKVLRVLYRSSDVNPVQLCEVLTLDGSSQPRWRGKKAPPGVVAYFGYFKIVVIDGIVYFLKGQDRVPNRIASFDLEIEEWRATIRGPSLVDNGDGLRGSMFLYLECLSVCALNDHLVVVHRMVTLLCSMDLWFCDGL
uniref:F-box associated beta-propeller type 3 domain-containing protein n=1 Tax=Arundo donax TaxID=35708 RepID=A0A0A9HTP3_ARUDO